MENRWVAQKSVKHACMREQTRESLEMMLNFIPNNSFFDGLLVVLPPRFRAPSSRLLEESPTGTRNEGQLSQHTCGRRTTCTVGCTTRRWRLADHGIGQTCTRHVIRMYVDTNATTTPTMMDKKEEERSGGEHRGEICIINR